MKLSIPVLILLGSASVACGDDTASNGDMPANNAGSPGAGGGAGGTSGGSSSGGTASSDGGSMAMGGSAQGGAGEGGAGQAGSAAGGETSGGGAAQGGQDQGGAPSGGSGGAGGSGGGGGAEPGPDAEVEVMMETTGVSGDWADFAATATFTEEDGLVTLSIVATAGCPDGEHAWHIHQNGSCGGQGDDAGGHWQVSGNLQAGERGDALTCADGAGTTEVMVPNPAPPEVGWTLMDGDYSLRDHAIVIHEGGVANPGGRMACGVVPAED